MRLWRTDSGMLCCLPLLNPLQTSSVRLALVRKLTRPAQDVATYTITSANRTRYLVDERVPSKSRICGGIFLEDGFRLLLRDKIRAATGDSSAEDKVSRRFIEDSTDWWKNLVRSLQALPDGSGAFSLPMELVYPGLQPSYVGAPGHVVSFSRQVIPLVPSQAKSP